MAGPAVPRPPENVADYPRPPRLERIASRLRVVFAGVTVADTTSAWRVLETGQPPTYYLPVEDVRTDLLVPTGQRTLCEWKGEARYWTIRAEGREADNAAWSYPAPTDAFRAIRHHLAFYPDRVDACFVDGEKVLSQAGGYYGGWITRNIAGPFKGGRQEAVRGGKRANMAGFRVQGFNHTNFTVSDLDRALAFFCGCLDFELLSRAPRDPALIGRMTGLERPEIEIAFVRGPGHTIELIEYRSPADRGRVSGRLCDAGASHVALDVDHVEAAVQAAKAHGFSPVGEIIRIDAGPNQGRQVVYLRDADGVTIEFIGPPG